MGNTKDTGDTTEALILHELVSRGYSVSIPFGDNDKYDLVVEGDGDLLRVKCKTGWLEDARVRFKTVSTTTEDGDPITEGYAGRIDAFAVRCRETDRLYWVPEPEAGTENTYLRTDEPTIDHPSVNHADEYVFDERLP
ncbi:MAG: group I intron-associated PD-(D/E)XK endonuclease [Haloarculaceae archaeon]